MTLKVAKAEIWSTTLEDRAGGAADKLEALTAAGANFEFVFARRMPESPGQGLCLVAPVKGKKVMAAAAAAGFVRAPGTKFVGYVALDSADDAAKAAGILRKL